MVAEWLSVNGGCTLKIHQRTDGETSTHSPSAGSRKIQRRESNLEAGERAAEGSP